MIQQNYDQEQQQCELQVISKRNIEADSNCSLEATGRFDFISGAEPDPGLVINYFYRIGYQNAFWQYYSQKYGKVVAQEF